MGNMGIEVINGALFPMSIRLFPKCNFSYQELQAGNPYTSSHVYVRLFYRCLYLFIIYLSKIFKVKIILQGIHLKN